MRCEFGLCRAGCEYVIGFTETAPALVCGLHITPAIRWGAAEPRTPAIYRLPDDVAVASVLALLEQRVVMLDDRRPAQAWSTPAAAA